MIELLNRGLPKWPALIVIGDKITEEQAMEVILRTDGLTFCTNDKKFEEALNSVVYSLETTSFNRFEAWIQKTYPGETKESLLAKGISAWNEYYEFTSDRESLLKQIPLEYLRNSRVVSSWIGGAHGWCDWEGNIFSNNYNIGKWPSVETVYLEWQIIASEFPFLNLRSQLLSGETCEENVQPVVEFIVSNGTAQIVEPKELLTKISDTTDDMVEKIFLNVRNERGCTLKQFKNAVNLVSGNNPIFNLFKHDDKTL